MGHFPRVRLLQLTAFRSRFSRRTVGNLKVAYEIAITCRKWTIPSFQPGEVSVHRLYTEADGPKGPIFVRLFVSRRSCFQGQATRRNARTSDPYQAFMLVHRGPTKSNTLRWPSQPGKVANPARGQQLNRENELFAVLVCA